MKKEVRTAVYDDELRVEAYRFEGIAQPFPNHFHEYYVIGFMEAGERVLSCKNREYAIAKGDILLFNPGDNHACDQSGGKHLGIIRFPVPILRGSPEAIRSIRETLYQPHFQDLTVVDFSDLAQGCKTYDEFMEKMGQTSQNTLRYFGIAICGAKKKVSKLTGGMTLLH